MADVITNEHITDILFETEMYSRNVHTCEIKGIITDLSERTHGYGQMYAEQEV
jgi:hypothetical protein